LQFVGVDLERSDGVVVARFGDNWLAVEATAAVERFIGKRVILGVRPEHIEDAALATNAPPGRKLEAVVDIREDLGSDIYVHFGVSGPPVRCEDVKAAVGEDAVAATEAHTKQKGTLWVARVGLTSAAQEGKPLDLVVDTSHLRFFDPETGSGIYTNRR